MTKYHIKPDGEPGVCTAEPGNCKYGSDGEHFESFEGAQRYSDVLHERDKLHKKLQNKEKLTAKELIKYNKLTKEIKDRKGVKNLDGEKVGKKEIPLEKEKKTTPTKTKETKKKAPKKAKRPSKEDLVKIINLNDGRDANEDLDSMNEKRRKHVDYLIKNYDYVQLDSGEVVDIGEKTPSIKNTIYYSDEYDSPSITFENFKDYNEKMTNNSSLYEHTYSSLTKKTHGTHGETQTLYIMDHYYNNHGLPDEKRMKSASYLVEEDVEDYKKKNINVRKATEEERQELEKAAKEAKDRYHKRLERYWKRYSDKVSTYGYWANR